MRFFNYYAILDDLGDKFISQCFITKKIVIHTPIWLWVDELEKQIIQHFVKDKLISVSITFRGLENMQCCLEYYKLDEFTCKLIYKNETSCKKCDSIKEVYQFIDQFTKMVISKNMLVVREYLTGLLKLKHATNIQYENGIGSIKLIKFDFPRQVFNIFESSASYQHQFFRDYDSEFKISSEGLEKVFIHYFSSHQAFSGKYDDYDGIKSAFTIFQGFDSTSYNFWILVALRCNFLQYYGITSVNGKRFCLEYQNYKFFIYITWLKDYTFELQLSIDSKWINTLDTIVKNPNWNDLKYSQLVKIGQELLKRDETYDSGSDY